MQREQPQFGVTLGDEALLRYFWQCYEDSKSHFSGWRQRLPRLFAMYGGRMLTDLDRAYLKSVRQPSIEFNFALGTLNAILGQDMANKSEVTFRGEDLSWADSFQADWMTQLGKHYMGRCHGLTQEWDALHEMLCTGYGWANGYLNVNVIPLRGEVERVHCWEMYPDPDASADCLTDMRFLIRERQWSLEEAQAHWPKASRSMAGMMAPGRPTPSWFPRVWRTDEWRRVKGVGDPLERLLIREFQYKRFEPYVRFWDATTSSFLDVPEAEWRRRMSAVSKTAGEDGMPQEKPESYPYAKECHYRAFIACEGGGTPASGGVVLQHDKLTVSSFTYNCVTGYKDKDPEKGRVVFFGPAQVIYDAQHYINRALSLILEIIATSSKGGGFIERGALDSSVQQFERDQAIPGKFHVVADGAVSEKRILQKQPQAIPPIISEFLRLCMDALGRLTGVTDFVKGTATSERSNVLVSNLQQQSMTLLLPLFEPLQQFRIRNGVLLLRILLKHLPPQELDRVLGAEPVEGLTHEKQLKIDPETGQPMVDQTTGLPTQETELVPITQKDAEGNDIAGPDGDPLLVTAGYLLKQRDPLEYDVTADVGQASPTMKFMVWNVFSQTELLQIMKEAGMPVEAIMPRLLRYLPIPADMAQKLADDLEEATGKRPLSPQEILEGLSALHPAERMQIIQQAQMQDSQAPPPPAAAAA